VDEWPGTDYEGTSVRAGAKVLQDWGYIDQYVWAWDINDLIEGVLYLGPVVLGTNWYSGMFEPDPKTHIVKPSGGIAGGHAYEIYVVNKNTGLARIKNSWGIDWGDRGTALISFEDVERLLSEDGEACIAFEKKVV
jgi:hypothetical protein